MSEVRIVQKLAYHEIIKANVYLQLPWVIL